MIKPSELPKELDQLRQAIEKFPASRRRQLLLILERLGHFVKVRSHFLEIMQEDFDQLQLEFKCLQFDLEATCRERDELQKDCEALWRRLDGNA